MLTREEIIRRATKKRLNVCTGKYTQLPPLNSINDLPVWVAKVEEELMDRETWIPRSQWADAAIAVYLSEPLSMLMRQQRAHRMEVDGEDKTWMWEDFQLSLFQVLQERDCRSGIQTFREDHPIAATVAGAGLVTAGSLVLAPAIIVGGLNAVGFTASGVAGGSIATVIQSSAYGGLTTGLFSTCQSIGATWAAGSASGIISGIGSLAAGATVLSAAQKETKG